MSQPLNYCRQVVAQFSRELKESESGDPRFDWRNRAIEGCKLAQKFIVPANGLILEDRELRALDDSVPLRLPFPVIALECQPVNPLSLPAVPEGYVLTSKHLQLVTETEDGLEIMPVIWHDEMCLWVATPPCLMPKTHYLLRDMVSRDGFPGVRLSLPETFPEEGKSYAENAGVLLNLLNALQCSNVHIESAGPPRPQRKKASTSLPFDEYHILTVDVPRSAGSTTGAGGTHASPREHLRRGHIRRLQSGLKVWVNACVVGSGNALGRIEKSYDVRVNA